MSATVVAGHGGGQGAATQILHLRAAGGAPEDLRLELGWGRGARRDSGGRTGPLDPLCGADAAGPVTKGAQPRSPTPEGFGPPPRAACLSRRPSGGWAEVTVSAPPPASAMSWPTRRRGPHQLRLEARAPPPQSGVPPRRAPRARVPGARNRVVPERPIHRPELCTIDVPAPSRTGRRARSAAGRGRMRSTGTPSSSSRIRRAPAPLAGRPRPGIGAANGGAAPATVCPPCLGRADIRRRQRPRALLNVSGSSSV